VTTTTSTPLFEARNVTKVFGGGMFHKSRTVALENFTFAIPASPPTVTAVVGESGSGKTTFARLLLGLVTPTSGEVHYKGKDLLHLSSADRRAMLRDIQVIFQDPYEVYNPFYKVDHVLETPITEFKLAKSKQAARSLIEDAMRAVGLRPEETLGRYPHQLSGGQRQRIMIARALLIKPSIIVADEPVSMVDASLRATILDSLRTLNREFGISLVYITHDLTTAYQISDNIIVLYKGGVAEAGDVEQVVKSPKHPYTQLLVGSVPQPDPNVHWGEEPSDRSGKAEPGQNGTVHAGENRCKFADRCPHVMQMCWQSAPPPYRTDTYRAAACFLYRDQGEALKTEQLDQVMIPPQAVPA
jgi:peptide/nickel transport system ATP-binding protein